MATGIQINSVLNLSTEKAERQLQAIASGVKPVSLPINFSSTEIEQKVAELKKVTFDWSVTPDIEFKAIANLQEMIADIRVASDFKIVPDVGFVDVIQLRRDIEEIRARSTIDVVADVNFAEVNRLKQDFAELRSQSEVRLKLASDAQDITIGNAGQKYGEVLAEQAKEQVNLLGSVIDEQRNTQQTVRAESAVSIGNFVKGKFATSIFDAAKNAAVTTFDIDTGFFEKALNNILPSTKILAADLKDMAAKFDEASGGSKRVKKLVDDLLIGFAESSAGANSIEEISDRFKESARESFGEFNSELEKTKDKFSDLQAVLKAIGIDTDALEYSLLTTKTGGSIARGLSKTLDRPLAERKDTIQTERLGLVLERAEELSAEKVKQSKKRAKNLASNYKNALAAVDDEVEELLLVIGGLATKENSGVLRAIEINQQLEKTGQLGKKAAVGFKNPDSFRPPGLTIKQGFPLAVARPNLRGFSKDAEEIAAQAVAALTKNPNLTVKLVGESAGGFAVEEAVQILNKLGFGDRIQGAGFGTPSLNAKASRSNNYQGYLGTNKDEALGYEVQNLFTQLGLVAPEAARRPNPQVAQDLKGLAGHTIENYYGLDEFRSFVLDDDTGRKQTRATINDIKQLQERVIDSILSGSVEDALGLIDEIEQNVRITGKSREPFDQLKTDVASLTKDVDSGAIAELNNVRAGINRSKSEFDNEQFAGNVDYFNDLKADIPKIQLLLKRLSLDTSKITQELINDIDRDLTDLRQSIPAYSTPELLKADYIRRRTDDVLNTLADIEPEEAIRTITDIEPVIKQYLADVRSLDDSADKTKIQGALESQLKTIKAARKLALLAVEFDFDELVKNPGEYLKIIRDASLEKAKEAAKKKSLNAAQELATKVNDTVDNFVEDFKDRILEAIEIVKAKALPGAGTNTPLLSGDKGGGLVKANESGIVKSNLSDAGQALLIRAIADTVVTGKNTYSTLQKIEQGLFDIFPLLRAGKAITQTAAPVIGGVALASQSPEIAALAKLSATELATVIQPLLQLGGGAVGDLASNIPGIGGGARAAIQFLANNGALTSSAASGAGALTAYGAIGGGAGAVAKAGARLAGRKTFDALPESLKDRLTPEAITAFDSLVSTRQAEIKQLAGSLNQEIAALKASDSKEGTQKLLAGYQQLNEEIKELETAVSSSDKAALQKTRDRVKELKGIQKGIRKAINKVADKGKKIVTTTVESIFEVEIAPVDSDQVTKKTLKSAIADYKREIIAHRKKLEKKILDGSAVDSDFQAAGELARRGQALSDTLKQRRGFSREARGLRGVSDTLASKIPSDKNALTASDEVINGILKGTNEKLAQVFIQGRTLGIELLDGFKTELEIKSPSGKFIKGMSDVAAGIIEGRKQERDRIRQAGEDIGADLFAGSKIGLGEYQDLLTNLETLIQQKNTLQSNTYQQAFDAPNSDISEQLEQINQLESQIQSTADAIAAFQEGAMVEVEIEIGEVEEPELPEVDPIEVEVEVGDAELNEFINDIPDDIELEVEANTGNSDRVLNRLDRNLERVRNTAQTALKALIGFGVLQVSNALTNQLEDIVRQSIETQIKFEQLETSINFVAGSAEKGAESLAFVGDTARKLKIDLAVATEGYKQLAASANGTELEAETNRIFTSVTQASRVFGLSAEQTEGAVLAISQIISKGTVQAEELRGQLGERIPGAFQIAARSMNVTTQELGKLLETGQLTAEEFLPKFARQLESETAGGVTGAINTTGAALQGLRSSYTQFQLDLAKTTRPAQIALYTTLAESLELAGDNLEILIPAAKILTATLITLFLPAIVSLGGLLKGAIAKGFTQLLKLLHANNASLSTMAKTARIASAALKTLVVIEAISQAIALTHNLTTINQEAADAVKNLDIAYQNFLETLNNNQPDNPVLKEDIITGNIQKAKDELGFAAKTLDTVFDNAVGRLVKKAGARTFNNTALRFLPGEFDPDTSFAEAAIEDAEAKAIEAIAIANGNLSKIPLEIGINLDEVETNDLQAAVDTINAQIKSLEAVDPTTVETLESRTAALDRQKEKLAEYNDELSGRGGLVKSLASIEVIRQKAVDDATEAEINALNQIDKEILESGDLKRDVELDKLQITQTRIDAELAADKQAIAEFEELIKQRNLQKLTDETAKIQAEFNRGAISARDLEIAIANLNDKYLGLDPDTGLLKELSDKEIEAYTKRRDRIIALEKEAVSSLISIANEEVASKLRIYDRYLEEVEGRRQEAEERSIAAEKERLIELQQLYNQDLISRTDFDRLKVASSKEQVASQLDEEKRKLRELKRFKTKEKEVQEQLDNDIKASKTKVLDLTLELLQQEKQATEDTINAIAQSRDNVFSALENRLNRLQQIQQTEAQLVSDRATAEEKLGDLQVAKLRQALELRKQINSGDLNDNERRTALRQLRDLGVQGRTSEIALLNQIKDKEKEIAAQKLATLLKQQEFAQTQLEIENELLRISTKKAEIEAKKGLNEAEKQLNSAETAIATAETQAEFDQANKLYNLALDSYQIAQDEVNLTQQQANSLEDIINKKQENLKLTQAIARVEAKAEGKKQKAEVEKELNAARESRDRRLGRNLDKYLSTQEKIDREVEGRRQKVESRGGEFSEEDEQKLRRRLMKAEGRKQRAEGRRFATPKPVTITAPPEILEAIRTGKPITVPAIAPFKSTAPLQTTTIERNDPNSDRVLQVLKKIETKFKQPTVIKVQNDNQFVNQYQRNDTDEILRQIRSEQVDIMNNMESYVNNNL